MTMTTKKNLKKYARKLFCVSTTRYIKDGVGNTTFTVLPKLFVSLDSALEKVAGIVNERLAIEKKKKRIKPMDCTGALHGGVGIHTDEGSIVIKVTAFDRPWSVQYMNCDKLQASVELYPDKESAEQAVSKKAKAGIKALGNDKPDYIYAYRDGDEEIEAKDIKKSEPYIQMDTIDGNHIDWTAKQL